MTDISTTSRLPRILPAGNYDPGELLAWLKDHAHLSPAIAAKLLRTTPDRISYFRGEGRIRLQRAARK